MADDTRDAQRSARHEWMLASMARVARAVEHVRSAAEAADDPLERALAWLAALGLAERARRDLDTSLRARRLEALAADLAAQKDLLDGYVAEARTRVATLDPAVRAEAERRRGIRIAVVGKGGAGKSMISATLARVLARQGRKVLAADLDTNHGMGFSLGMGTTDAALPAQALEENGGSSYGWQLASDLRAHEAVERHARTAADGVRFLTLGKIEDPEKQDARRSVVAVRQVLAGFAEPGWDLIGDLEAGPTTPFERYHGFADQVVLVVGPAWRSALTARRLLPIVAGTPTIIVANRFRDEPDHEGLPPTVRVPYDASVAEAERQGIAPIDFDPDSPAMKAVGELAGLFTSSAINEEVVR